MHFLEIDAFAVSGLLCSKIKLEKEENLINFFCLTMQS